MNVLDNPSERCGRLTLGRGFNQSLIMRLSPDVDEMLFAHELFVQPLRLTILRGRGSDQIKVEIFADRRISILREEIVDKYEHFPEGRSVSQLYRQASLALAFMRGAETMLDAISFQRILQAARDTMDAAQARTPCV